MPTSSPHDRLAEAIGHATGLPTSADALRLVRLTDPAALTAALARYLPGRYTVTGTLERRLLVAEHVDRPGWTVADLSGQPHETRDWPLWTQRELAIERPARWLSPSFITDAGIHRLLAPRVLLVALYHPEFFPLPRFPLAISDLARAARATLTGQIRLVDMQLGVTLNEIVDMIGRWRPDIVGVSATFGQHDLMTRLLDHVTGLPDPPLAVAGGSLTVRNEALLLERYPNLLVSRGAGEPTIQDVLAYWHSDLDLADVRGIGYHGAFRGVGLAARPFRRTATVANRAQTDFLPELDLLDATFARRGVAQLETSRGCTNFCSFCPRGHKGTWAGAMPAGLPWILHAIGEAFDRHPHISRTLFLVDEEFIGRGDDAADRALAIADTLHRSGFGWESSCRVDQVADPGRDRAWHTDRARMWRTLVERGLRRMLFGVESGVTSILDRFNKETTGGQNALAIRTLSALGVPTRFTYITFDPLMSLDELNATHAFQARTDLLLRPLPDLTVDEIVDGVRDEEFVAAHTTGRPFYTAISYMLVSMECLIGAAYTKQAEAAGLTRAVRPAMGRVDADFADWRIGACSHHGQLWIDRNFALDYTLKSLEKLLDGAPRRRVREARVVIKSAAFTVLSRMLDLVPDQPRDGGDPERLDAVLTRAMDDALVDLGNALADTVAVVAPALPRDAADLLRREHERWALAGGWQLINAADACGT